MDTLLQEIEGMEVVLVRSYEPRGAAPSAKMLPGVMINLEMWCLPPAGLCTISCA